LHDIFVYPLCTPQLWLDNEMLDENGIRNYMSNAQHTAQGARVQGNVSDGPAEQLVEAMGRFQFNGFSFGIEGSAMAKRPADAPPLNSFLVWRGNAVGSNGGFGIGSDLEITPGEQAPSATIDPDLYNYRLCLALSAFGSYPPGISGRQEQPRMAEMVLEHNTVAQSSTPLIVGHGASGLYGRGNSFAMPAPPST
jgi:hypothetical protein